ncbi:MULTISPECIES: PAS domain-containing protein [Hyphomonas]|uniref:PAS domain-containing protein n=1 Tax=Hyphomonas TaxID=85 RepID=UPI003510F486
MQDRSIHPNTRIMLEAWKRMRVDPVANEDRTPRANDHPDLIANIFMIEATDDGAWIFRTAGDGVSDLLGRSLPNHDFLNLWTGPDRAMIGGFLDAVRTDGAPGVIRGRGETLTGQRVEVEITTMPLEQAGMPNSATRFLGLYQTLGGVPKLKGRPIWRHRVAMLVPPDSQPAEPTLKLVANNYH